MPQHPIEQHIPLLTRYAKSLTSRDPEDIVQSTLEKSLRVDQAKLSAPYLMKAIKNTYLNTLGPPALMVSIEEAGLVTQPEAEVNIICRQEHINLYDWPSSTRAYTPQGLLTSTQKRIKKLAYLKARRLKLKGV